MRQIIQGFSRMYCVNVVHRDLKPENIMINFTGKTSELMDMSPEDK